MSILEEIWVTIGIGIGLGVLGLGIWGAAVNAYRQKKARERVEESMALARANHELFNRQLELLERQVAALEKLTDRQQDTILLLRQLTESRHESQVGIQERDSTMRPS